MKKHISFVLALVLISAAAAAFAAELTITVIRNPGEIPPALAGFAQKGDFLISDGKYTAVIAESPRPSFSTINYGHPDVSGYLLAFLPEGGVKRAPVQIGIPSVRINGEALPVGPATVRQDGPGIVVRASVEGKGGLKLGILTRYTFAFASGRITIVSEIKNTGSTEASGLSFGLVASALQNFNFSPFDARSFPKLNFRVWQRPDHALGWLNPNPLETGGHPLPGRLRPGQAHRISYSVVAGSDPVEVLNRLYALAGIKPEQVPVALPDFNGPTEIIVKNRETGVVFYRAFMDKPAPSTLPLPRGSYGLRVHLFPAVIERDFAVEASSSQKPLVVKAPVFGRVNVSIVDGGGRPALGKVSFIGLDPSPSPYFRPENPVATGRGWEGFKNSVYPFRKRLEVVLPAGTYLAVSSRGPEYTRAEKIVEICAGENPALEFRLDKAVDARGLLSIDTHMHTQNSDGSMLIPDRLRSIVAEGLDAAVATDHNFVTDYRPDLKKLGLEADLAVIVGNEVTARTGSIHYNTFPNTVRPDEPKNGAISVKDETPDTLFGLSRTKDPGTLIQVNHPRSRGLGYFLTYDLESGNAASAQAPFSLDFDVMEAMNGAHVNEANRLSIEDLFHLLNRGYPIRGVGVSDSHGIDGSEPGYARTYILYDGPKGADLDQAAVVKALKEGRSFLSNGPIISIRANGRSLPGDLVKAGKGRVDLDLRVLGAPWLDVSEVRLVVNGERKEALQMKGADGKSVKFRDRVRLALERDSWVAVEVKGRASLYPVIQQRSSSGSAAGSALPYALTNPIFFDVDGNGRCDPVQAGKVAVK